MPLALFVTTFWKTTRPPATNFRTDSNQKAGGKFSTFLTHTIDD